VLPDPRFKGRQSEATRVLLCTGKLYWELDAYREANGITDVAVVRLEQLYPLPKRKLNYVIDQYSSAKEFYWVQEEPKNQGAWPFLVEALPEAAPKLRGLKRSSRRAMAAPSAGSAKVHEVEQKQVITKAFSR